MTANLIDPFQLSHCLSEQNIQHHFRHVSGHTYAAMELFLKKSGKSVTSVLSPMDKSSLCSYLYRLSGEKQVVQGKMEQKNVRLLCRWIQVLVIY